MPANETSRAETHPRGALQLAAVKVWAEQALRDLLIGEVEAEIVVGLAHTVVVT